MTVFLFLYQLALALAAAYFLVYRGDKRNAALALILMAKGCIIFFLLTGSFAAAPLMTALFAGMIVIACFTGAAPAGQARAGKGQEYAAFTVFMALLLLLSGCAGKPRNFPAITKEINLKFVPSRIAAAPKDMAYIGTERGNKIYLYDLKQRRSVKVINAGYNPVEILIKNNRLYSANERNASVTVYDPASGTAESMSSGGEYPSALALNPEKNLLYVANTGSSNVAIIDLNARSVKKRIQTGKWPSDLYLTPDYKSLFVSCKYTNTVQLIDTQRERSLFTRIETGVSPVQLIPLDRRHLAIINEWEYSFIQQSAINIFDMKNYGLNATIRVDGGIFNGVLSRSGKYLIVSVPLKDRIIFVDIKKRQTAHTMALPDQGPRWLALSKDGSRLYVAAQHSKKFIIISLNDFI